MRWHFVLLLLMVLTDSCLAGVTLIHNGKPVAEVLIDKRGTTKQGEATLQEAGAWLVRSLKQATGVELKLVDKTSDSQTVILARADAWREVARQAGLKSGAYHAYCIVTKPKRVYVLGNSETATRHGIAYLLRRWGFRFFAPSPKWHSIPKLTSAAIDVNVVEQPQLVDRRIWYAYGLPGDDFRELMQNYRQWAMANRLSIGSLIQTGHSYGNIIRRNLTTFEKHPEYYALLPDGKRDSERAINARKLCFSNKELIDLVIADRLQLLQRQRKVNPAAFMVSVDPSDGQGTCHCEECKKLGTTSDRVFHLANEVAKGLKKKIPEAWVGLYAYSSHRLPPTIRVEPNVYVQVAMGFNRTKYSLPELVSLWSKKVGAIGLREYYGVEAWDWGLPGRARGGQTAYHRKWIPYYAKRKLNAINAETNANWGAQTLGLYVASQLMWNPNADVDALKKEFFTYCFHEVAKPMEKWYADLESSPPLRPSTLLPMFQSLQKAWTATKHEEVKQRLVDLMAYLVYVAEFRKFDLARSRKATRDDGYYRALLPLMNYAWRIRHRDMVHYYALARRLCNGLPVRDKRLDFYMFNKKAKPVWMKGETFSDKEIISRFETTIKELQSDGDPTVSFSRYLEPIRYRGQGRGPSRILNDKREGIARFRRGLVGYLVPSGKQMVKMTVAPTKRPISMKVTLRDQVYFSKQIRSQEEVEIELPRANEYRVEINGDCEVQVPKSTPFVFEASVRNPSWIDYSGPHYFYVPKGTRELIVDATPRLSFFIPGGKARVDISASNRVKGKEYSIIKVPSGAAGKVWQSSPQTRGRVMLLNVPPLMSFHPETLFVPREIAERDGLTTKE